MIQNPNFLGLGMSTDNFRHSRMRTIQVPIKNHQQVSRRQTLVFLALFVFVGSEWVTKRKQLTMTSRFCPVDGFGLTGQVIKPGTSFTL